MSSAFLKKSLQLATTVATEKLLHFILQEALRITGSNTAGIFIFESSRPERVLAGTIVSCSVLTGRYGRAKLQAAAATNQHSTKLGFREYPAFPSELPLFSDCGSTIFAPLREANRTLGWLIAGHSSPAHYAPQDLQLLDDIAGESVSAIFRSLLRTRMADGDRALDLVGSSPELLEVERQARIAAIAANGSVLITGERGSGKELVAEAVHFFSDRYRRPFLPVLSSSFSEGLFADELFGHERFAFTGASHDRKGKFQAAEGGTVFLDEVGDLEIDVQAGLLRVLERGELPKIGRDTPLRVDVRIVAATNRDLDKLMTQEKFRHDLYDRLSVFEIRVPPLRFRKQDIVPLTTHFLRDHCTMNNQAWPFEGCDGCNSADRVCCAKPGFYDALLDYNWPGNVRELAHVMLQIMATYPGQALEADHLPDRIRKPEKRSISPAAVDDDNVEGLELSRVIERHLQRVIGVTKGNKTKAAKLLGLPRSTLNAMLRRYGF